MVKKYMKWMEYKIKSIQDITKVINKDNIENFIIDFRGVLDSYLVAKEVSNSVEMKSFTWIDDGKHEITIKLTGKK